MLVKSVFTVISVYETKFARKNFSEILDTKGREPIFQVWGGGKKGGNQNFPKILGREPKPYTLCPLDKPRAHDLEAIEVSNHHCVI